MSSLGDKASAGLVGVVGQAGRFLVVGLANTLATGAIFYALAFSMPAWLAYSIAFGLGVVFAVAVTPRIVFLVRPPARRRAFYAGWYLVVYGIGLGAVQLLDGAARLDHGKVVVFTVAMTAVLSFLGGRAILTTGGPREER